ncbi:MAG: hypothetical protein Q4F31_03835 [Eubacteriales bacterium]|nr:hypothetical protein [Eubacteriales bacterium]
MLCLIPSVGMIAAGPSKAAGNEILSPVPRLEKLDGTFNPEVLSEASSWFDDRFALRQQLSTAWSRINALLFGCSVNDDVILGQEGWLFFADSLNDYTGQLLPDEVIESAALHLAELRDCCHENGAEFVFTVAPNKNSLYPEYMPKRIPAGKNSNVDRLYRRLSELGVDYADLHEAFRGKDEVLYFHTDSHWNSKGAAVAADNILSAVGVNCGFSLGEFGNGKTHTGDLFEMLYPSGKSRETDPEYLPGFSFRSVSDPQNGNAIEFSTENPSGSGHLLCWRDSFGISLYPYLAEHFASADFSRSSDYDPERIRSGEYDTVVLEIVERNISWLAQ